MLCVDPDAESGLAATRLELPSPPDHEVVVHLERVIVTPITVRVIDRATGNNLTPDTAVAACPRAGSGRVFRFEIHPVDDDRSLLMALSPEVWDFIATAADGRIGFVAGIDLRANDPHDPPREIVITLDRGAWITVHLAVPDAAGSREPRLELRARVGEVVLARELAAAGSFVDLHVPAGRVALELLREGKLLATDGCMTAADETLEVELHP
jgi:hypothetical protein